MNREDFIAKMRDKIAGPILDCLVRQAQGSELSLLLRQLHAKLEQALGEAWDKLRPPLKVVPPSQRVRNGHPEPLEAHG